MNECVTSADRSPLNVLHVSPHTHTPAISRHPNLWVAASKSHRHQSPTTIIVSAPLVFDNPLVASSSWGVGVLLSDVTKGGVGGGVGGGGVESDSEEQCYVPFLNNLIVVEAVVRFGMSVSRTQPQHALVISGHSL